MQERPLNTLIAQIVDEYVQGSAHSFDKQEVVDRVLSHPEIRLMRRGYDAHDRSEGLEAVFLRDVARLVTARLRRDGCVAQRIGGGKYRWYRPEQTA